MNIWMKILNVLLEFFLYVLLLSLLGAPLVLIVFFPAEAEYFTRFAEIMVPWGIALFLAAIFSGGFKSLFTKIIEKLHTLTSLSAGGTKLKFQPQNFSGTNITKEQLEREISNENNGKANLASFYFIKYIGTTIYGSQVRLLESAVDISFTSLHALNFYNQFIANAPELTNYKFENWMEYLVDNVLIQSAKNGTYTITNAGKLFLDEVKKAGMKAESFKN